MGWVLFFYVLSQVVYKFKFKFLMQFWSLLLCPFCCRGSPEAPPVPKTKQSNPQVLDWLWHRDSNHWSIWGICKYLRAPESYNTSHNRKQWNKMQVYWSYSTASPPVSSCCSRCQFLLFVSLTAAGCCLAGTLSGMSFFSRQLRTVTATKQEESAEACRVIMCDVLFIYVQTTAQLRNGSNLLDMLQATQKATYMWARSYSTAWQKV